MMEGCSKLARLEGIEIVKYTCQEVLALHEKWKEETRKNLCVRPGKRDRHYDEYCESIDTFLKKCTCKKKENGQLDKDERAASS